MTNFTNRQEMVTLRITKCDLNIQNLPLSIKYFLIVSVAIVLVMLTKMFMYN